MAGTNAPIVDRIRIIPRAKEFLDRASGSSGEVFFSKETNTLRLFSGRTINRGGFEVLTDSSMIRNTSAKNVAAITYPVTIAAGNHGAGDHGNVYVLNGEYKPELDFIKGYTYVFDQSDQTNVYYPNPEGGANNQHPIFFSADDANGDTASGTEYTTGVMYILDDVEVTRQKYQADFQRATDRRVVITVDISAPETLYYYCANHLNMGNEITISMPGTGTGSASVSASSAAPEEPENGSVWFDAETGNLYVYLVDVDSGQWVQPSIPIADSLLDLGITDATVAGQILSSNADGTFEFIDLPDSGGGGGDTGNLTFTNNTIDTTDSNPIIITPDLTLSGNLTTEGSGTPELVSDNEILLTATTRVSMSSSPLKLASFDNANRDLLIAEAGDLIYNTSLNSFEGYQNGAWGSLGASGGGGISSVSEDTAPQLGGNLDVASFILDNVRGISIDTSIGSGKITIKAPVLTDTYDFSLPNKSKSDSRLRLVQSMNNQLQLFAGVVHYFDVVAAGGPAYTFTDEENSWFPTDADNPELYLRRGETYVFEMDALGNPFEIRVAPAGAAYTTGVEVIPNNETGQVAFTIPMSAPATLYYQSTTNAGLGNTINIV